MHVGSNYLQMRTRNERPITIAEYGVKTFNESLRGISPLKSCLDVMFKKLSNAYFQQRNFVCLFSVVKDNSINLVLN